jgi:hypothetical protein
MTDPTKRPQKDLILEHLEKFGSITPLEAQRLYGCMRLGARIWDLKHEGHAIVMELVEVKTKSGNAHVARYRLAAA